MTAIRRSHGVRDDRLRCPLCLTPVGGMTGLQELVKLQTHMGKFHSLYLNGTLNLDLRWMIERGAFEDLDSTVVWGGWKLR